MELLHSTKAIRSCYCLTIPKFDVPGPEPTPEEITTEAKARLKRARGREAQRRYAERQKERERGNELRTGGDAIEKVEAVS